MIDAEGEAIGVSIYNLTNDAIKYEDTLTIFDPFLLKIHITHKDLKVCDKFDLIEITFTSSFIQTEIQTKLNKL
jgi:hypothetical protein